MYGIVVVTPPASAPVTTAEMRAWLRLNHTAEDSILDDLVAAAVDQFETEAQRPVLATVYRQHLSRWPIGSGVAGLPPLIAAGYPPAVLATAAGISSVYPGQVVLGRAGVTAIAGVSRTLADGTYQSLTGWSADLVTPPARVTLAAVPDPVTTAAGVPVSPVGYVQYTAGWADAAAVPKRVKTAIRLLAAHWYRNREAFTERKLDRLAAGWRTIVLQYGLGLTGDWGQ